MPRKTKPSPIDLVREAARQELDEIGGTRIDREPQLTQWKIDPVAFINDNKLLPTDLHPRQVEIIRASLEFDEHGKPVFKDMVINKTRQVGMSWMWMAFILWTMTMHPASRVLVASRKEIEVDDGGDSSTIRSLHGRVRYMYNERLPSWLRNRSPLAFKKLSITTKRGGFVAGYAATTDIGRGGTFDLALMDEFAHVDWSRLVWASVSQACKSGKIINSTPKGRGNEFFRLVDKHNDRRMIYMGYHWTQHPVFSMGIYTDADGFQRSPWYDAECAKLGAEDMIAQELDMSFDRSISARVYPEFDRRRHLSPTIRNPHASLICGWDYGYAGKTCMILMQIESYVDRTSIEVLAEHEGSGLHIDAYVPVVGQWEKLYGKIDHVGDPAGIAKNVVAGKGPIQALAEHDIYTAAPNWLHRDAHEGIRLVRVCLSKNGVVGHRKWPVQVVIDPSCDGLAEALENTHYPVDVQGQRREGIEMPADNEYTHMSDAFRYGIHWICRTMLGAETNEDEVDVQAFTAGVLTRGF